MLQKINIEKKRNLYFVVSLIDYLYIKGMNNPEKPYAEDFIPLDLPQRTQTDFSYEYKSLKKHHFYSLIRVIFSSDIIQNVILKRQDWKEKVEEMFKENNRAKEFFCNNPKATSSRTSFSPIIREYGDLGVYQPNFTTINNI